LGEKNSTLERKRRISWGDEEGNSTKREEKRLKVGRGSFLRGRGGKDYLYSIKGSREGKKKSLPTPLRREHVVSKIRTFEHKGHFIIGLRKAMEKEEEVGVSGGQEKAHLNLSERKDSDQKGGS